jgi:hypothetical protein
MNNITDTFTLIQVGYYAPTISPSIISYLQAFYILPIVFPFFCTGLTFSFQQPVVIVVGIILQVLLSLLLWYLENLIKWLRPADMVSRVTSPAILLNDALNLYGAPGSLLTASYIFIIVFIFIQYRVLRKGVNWLLALLTSALFVAMTIVEFLLGRILVAQYFVNLAIVVVLGGIFCATVELYYNYKRFRLLRQLRRQQQRSAASLAKATSAIKQLKALNSTQATARKNNILRR